jgi:hypothetical protein
MLDAERYIELFPEHEDQNKKRVFVRESMMIESLKTRAEKGKFAPDEFRVRRIFDDFLTDISTFQHHIDAKLLKLSDIKPYLEYWIKEMNGYGKIRSSAFALQLKKFLDDFEYDAVIRLSTAMGYPPK